MGKIVLVGFVVFGTFVANLVLTAVLGLLAEDDTANTAWIMSCLFAAIYVGYIYARYDYVW